MAGQHRFSARWISFTGGALVGTGLHILLGNLDRDTSRLRHFFCAPGVEGLGALPSTVLAASQAAQAYALDHRGFWLALLLLLISLWPLLLVVVGTVLLRQAVAEIKALPTPAKYFQDKDSGCRFCCPSFDA